jgi:transcriptional regulator with XRE-family HTH domain
MVDPTKPLPVPNKDNKFRSPNEDSIGMRIKISRENVNLTQLDLAKRLTHKRVKGKDKHYTRSTVAQWERNDSIPPVDLFEYMAKELNTTAEFLAFGVTMEPKVVLPKPDELGYVLVPEVTFRSEDATDEVAKWGLPVHWLRTEMGVVSLDKLVIYKVEADSAGFSFGDRIIIDRGSVRPTPSGKFLHWDGVGPVVSAIMVIPAHGTAKKPIAKVTGVDGTYETDIDKLHIIGRVKGLWAKA